MSLWAMEVSLKRVNQSLVVNPDDTLDLGAYTEEKSGEDSDEVVDNFFWTGIENANEPPIQFNSFIRG